MRESFDRSWRRRALAGDADAVRAFADAVLPPLYHFCLYRVGKDRHLCEEVVQDTLVRALRNLEQYEPDRAGGNIFPWLTGLARNEISRVLSLQKHGSSLEEMWRRMDRELLAAFERLETEPIGEAVLLREETREMVNVALAQLTPQYRQALEERYAGGVTIHDLASRWGTSDKAVESLLVRARKAFRAAFLALCHTLRTEPL